ncbi:MAG TPA: heavy metal-associated domain-containing protein [Acidobacteriaceae bacterium]
MKTFLVAAFVALFSMAAHAQYEQVNLTVFGMDCAPCAHAIHVSMKGIQGVDTVDVDLNTGLVTIKLAPDNKASMRQFNEAVEKNGFTHKDAEVIVRGKLTGTAAAPFLEVTGTTDRFALAGAGADIAALLGKAVVVAGVLPQAPKGRVADTLKVKSIAEAR